ncbi:MULTISPECIES: hypothetical protein [unclassified Mesorhizobium]
MVAAITPKNVVIAKNRCTPCLEAGAKAIILARNRPKISRR